MPSNETYKIYELDEQDSEFAQFSPRSLLMSKLTKLLPLACLKKYFPKVLERLSEFLYHYQGYKVGLSLMKVFLTKILVVLLIFEVVLILVFLKCSEPKIFILFGNSAFIILYIILLNKRQLVEHFNLLNFEQL